MKSKYSSVNEQQSKENQERLENELKGLHRRKFKGHDVIMCPNCYRTTLAVVLSEVKGIANCERCKKGITVNF